MTHMTSAFHFTGKLSQTKPSPTGKGKFEVEFEFTVMPPKLRLTIYIMDAFISRTLHSERFDLKARARPEDLDSRREWFTTESTVFSGEVWALSPIEIRGRMIDLEIHASWNPCFAIIRWMHGDVFMHIAVRPSPPYRDWVKGDSAPLSWLAAVSHLDEKLKSQAQHIFARSTRNFVCQTDIPIAPLKPRSYDFCSQFSSSSESVGCQAGAITRECGIGPDLIHLVTTLAVYRPYWELHPPWPTLRLWIADANGVIHGFNDIIPTPLEEQVEVNVYPPETTHEPRPPITWNMVPPHLLALLTHGNGRPMFRPPPLLPKAPPPPPPDFAPGYIPVPPGIRAVYTTQAMLLRSQPELNHPQTNLPRPRPRVEGQPSPNITDTMGRWVILSDTRPEINPIV